MEKKHTPDGWDTYSTVNLGPVTRWCGYSADGKMVVECTGKRAAMRTVAPELLAALENARNVLAGLASGDLKAITADSPALAQVRAAIAKATQS